MLFQELSIKGVMLIKPRVFEDNRGFFLEWYNRKELKKQGIDVDFVQGNLSRSKKNVLRGMHFQLPPFSQNKLVWVARGVVFDVVVDLRKDSPTFGRWCGEILSEENKHMLFIPKEFAHGFLVMSDIADFVYATTNFYSPEHDRGVIWNDTDIGIEWPIQDPILSDKDMRFPMLKELGFSF